MIFLHLMKRFKSKEFQTILKRAEVAAVKRTRALKVTNLQVWLQVKIRSEQLQHKFTLHLQVHNRKAR